MKTIVTWSNFNMYSNKNKSNDIASFKKYIYYVALLKRSPSASEVDAFIIPENTELQLANRIDGFSNSITYTKIQLLINCN